MFTLTVLVSKKTKKAAFCAAFYLNKLIR